MVLVQSGIAPDLQLDQPVTQLKPNISRGEHQNLWELFHSRIDFP
jgi:hypothetical protein